MIYFKDTPLMCVHNYLYILFLTIFIRWLFLNASYILCKLSPILKKNWSSELSMILARPLKHATCLHACMNASHDADKLEWPGHNYIQTIQWWCRDGATVLTFFYFQTQSKKDDSETRCTVRVRNEKKRRKRSRLLTYFEMPWLARLVMNTRILT